MTFIYIILMKIFKHHKYILSPFWRNNNFSLCFSFSTERAINNKLNNKQIFKCFSREQGLTLARTNYFSFSSNNKQQKSGQVQSEEQNSSKQFKLAQLKQLFETKMNKYNLKGLLKMYQILIHNNVNLSSQSLKLFDYRLAQELNQMDHESTNSVLQLLHKNNIAYQPKGNTNKLIRGINMKLQKNKINLQPAHVYKTLKLLLEMKFPKATISRVIYKLVMEDQVQKRLLYLVDNLKSLRISLLCLQQVQIQLQIKKRVLQNVLKIKPKGLVQTVYFYTVLKIAFDQLQKTVKYESQKKSVYDLAFNPYSTYEFQQEQPSQKKDNQTQKQNIRKQSQAGKVQINKLILKRLIQQKQKILQETFQKINVQKIYEEIQSQLIQYFKYPKNDDLSFRQLKQVSLALVSNGFSDFNIQGRKILSKLIQKVLNDGLLSLNSQEGFDASQLIRVSEFIILIQEIGFSAQRSALQSYFNKYVQTYQHFMSLQQKIMLIYHQSKLLNHPINLQQIKSEIQKIDYGLNAQEFVWLNKVLNVNTSKQKQKNQKIKQITKEIWSIVENKIDQQIETLKKKRLSQNPPQSSPEKQTKQKGQKDSKQQSHEKNKKQPK